MRMLTERLALATVESAHAIGWSIDSLEAQAFAYLAVRSLGGLPLTFLGTTGAPRIRERRIPGVQRSRFTTQYIGCSLAAANAPPLP
jgi:hypothetical protein